MLESVIVCLSGLLFCVFICGIFVLLLVYFRVLQVLGKYIEIYFFFINLCWYYWGDIKDLVWLVKFMVCQCCYIFEDCYLLLFCENQNLEVLFNSDGEQDIGNLLLVLWGKLGWDYIYLLFELENSQELDVFVDIMLDNFLYWIQVDIFELESYVVVGVNFEEYLCSDNKCLFDFEDNSFFFYVCYSLQCEVEILYDCLLVMLEVDLMLMLCDIIVMVVDIDSYSLFIQVVFGSVLMECYLFYVIFDWWVCQLYLVLQVFISLFLLLDSCFVFEDVLVLLDVLVLVVCFMINEEGLCYLCLWVNELGICWGIDDDNVCELEFFVIGQYIW